MDAGFFRGRGGPGFLAEWRGLWDGGVGRESGAARQAATVGRSRGGILRESRDWLAESRFRPQQESDPNRDTPSDLLQPAPGGRGRGSALDPPDAPSDAAWQPRVTLADHAFEPRKHRVGFARAIDDLRVRAALPGHPLPCPDLARVSPAPDDLQVTGHSS